MPEENADRQTPDRAAADAGPRRAAPTVPPRHERLSAPVAALLVQRLRVTAWVVLAIVLCFAADDLRVGVLLRWLALLRAAEVTLLLALIGLTYHPHARRYARRLALAGYVGICLLAAATGSLRGDLPSTWLILTTVAGGAAVLLPWGGRAQLGAAAVAALALVGSAVAIGHPLGSLFPHPGAAVLGLLILSIYAARELEAGRRSVAERDRMLRESERWREALIESLPVTVFRTILGGAEAGVMWHSDNVERLTGFAAARFAGPDGTAFWSSRVHPDDHAVYLAAMPALSRRRVATSEYRWRRADDTYRWLLVQAALLTDGAGHPLEVIGSVSDVSELRQAERELRERDLRYELVAQATNDAIWDWDLVGGGLRWNDAIQTLFGYPAAVGGDIEWWIDRIHPAERERVVGGMRAVIDGAGRTWADEYRWRRQDGSYAVVTDRGTVVRDSGGRPLRMIGAMTDIASARPPRRRCAPARRTTEP